MDSSLIKFDFFPLNIYNPKIIIKILQSNDNFKMDCKTISMIVLFAILNTKWINLPIDKRMLFLGNRKPVDTSAFK